MRRYRFKSRNRLGFLGNGADIKTAFNPSRFENPDASSLRNQKDGKDIVIGSVGRLTKSKGFPELFEVAKALKEKYPHVAFSVVGIPDDIRSDGIPKAEIEALAEDGTIRFVEPMPNTDMPELLPIRRYHGPSVPPGRFSQGARRSRGHGPAHRGDGRAGMQGGRGSHGQRLFSFPRATKTRCFWRWKNSSRTGA